MTEIYVFVHAIYLGLATRAKEGLNESGATAIEYALVASLMAGTIIIGVTQLGRKVQSDYNRISNTLPVSAP